MRSMTASDSSGCAPRVSMNLLWQRPDLWPSRPSPSALVVEEVDQRDWPAPGTAPSGQHAGRCGSPPRLMLVQPALQVIRVNGVIQAVRGLIPRGLEQPAPCAYPKIACERFGVGHVGIARGHAQQLLVQFDGVEQGRAELLSGAGRQRGYGLAFLGRDVQMEIHGAACAPRPVSGKSTTSHGSRLRDVPYQRVDVEDSHALSEEPWLVGMHPAHLHVAFQAINVAIGRGSAGTEASRRVPVGPPVPAQPHPGRECCLAETMNGALDPSAPHPFHAPQYRRARAILQSPVCAISYVVAVGPALTG